MNKKLFAIPDFVTKDDIKRVEKIIYEQMRKYPYLF